MEEHTVIDQRQRKAKRKIRVDVMFNDDDNDDDDDDDVMFNVFTFNVFNLMFLIFSRVFTLDGVAIGRDLLSWPGPGFVWL